MNGFENELDFITYINSNEFEKLNVNLKTQILKINNFKSPNVIKAVKCAGRNKADITLNIDNKKYNISIKKGTGNSIHQEPLENFICFLKLNLEDNELVFNDIRHFVWGDSTLDGSGKIKNRLSANLYKKKFPDKILNIQNYFEIHKKTLIERFLITGVSSTTDAHYLLYGSTSDCTIIGVKKILMFAIKSTKKPISIGVLTFQAWNRNIEGGALSEHKRGYIQLKWGSLKNDIKNI
jgi:hypothetical protein